MFNVKHNSANLNKTYGAWMTKFGKGPLTTDAKVSFMHLHDRTLVYNNIG